MRGRHLMPTLRHRFLFEDAGLFKGPATLRLLHEAIKIGANLGSHPRNFIAPNNAGKIRLFHPKGLGIRKRGTVCSVE